MSKLKWISDEALETVVQFLLTKAKEAHVEGEEKFGKNVIDPFSALFTMSGFNLDFQTWLKAEFTRQSQKSLQNHIGSFHQDILGSVCDWEDLGTGKIVDLVSKKNKIIAEIKNKHNTISGGKLSDLYHSLDSLVMPKSSIYKGFTAYYVAIIPKNKNRYNKSFTPSDKGKGARCPNNPLIREIDGASFYDLVTAEKDSLQKLYNILPLFIEDCTNGSYVFNEFHKLQEFFSDAFENLG